MCVHVWGGEAERVTTAWWSLTMKEKQKGEKNRERKLCCQCQKSLGNDTMKPTIHRGPSQTFF